MQGGAAHTRHLRHDTASAVRVLARTSSLSARQPALMSAAHAPQSRSLRPAGRRRGRSLLLCTAAALSSSSWLAHLLAPHNAAAVSQLLQSSGVFMLCMAAAVLLLASLPTLWAVTRMAARAEAVLKVVEQELPESAALLRLSGLEVTDCLSEVSGLGAELSSGLRSTAKLATMTEQGVRRSIQGVSRAVNEGLLPAAARTETAARSVLEAELQQRAQLKHTQEVARGVVRAAGAAAGAVRQARLGLQVVRLLGAAVSAGGALRQSMNVAAANNLASTADRAKGG